VASASDFGDRHFVLSLAVLSAWRPKDLARAARLFGVRHAGAGACCGPWPQKPILTFCLLYHRRQARGEASETGVEIVRKKHFSWPDAPDRHKMRAKTAPSSSARSLRRINTHTASTPRTTSTSNSVSKGIIDQPRLCGRRCECSVDRRASNHHGSHGRRRAEEGECLRPACLAVAWAAWRYGLLEPSLVRNGEARISPGFFLISTSEWSQKRKLGGKVQPSNLASFLTRLRVTNKYTGCPASCRRCGTRRELSRRHRSCSSANPVGRRRRKHVQDGRRSGGNALQCA